MLRPGELRGAFADARVRTWGSYDGSGDPIELTFPAYVERFVSPEIFIPQHELTVTEHARTEPGDMDSGHTRSNLMEVYPGATWIELYVPGVDPQFEGMDWARLAFVFVREKGTQKLRAIIRDQWTI